jgi:hypothetical protein
MVTAAKVNEVRGLVFDSLTSLLPSDLPTRRRALALHRINRQLELVEPWLASGEMVGTAASGDDVWDGVMLQVERARLLVPSGRTGSSNDQTLPSVEPLTSVTLPGVPESNRAYLLTLGGLRPLEHKRVAGGVRISLNQNERGMLLFTEDTQVVGNLMRRTSQIQSAAELSRQLALAEQQNLGATLAQLRSLGGIDPKADAMLRDAQVLIGQANSRVAANDFAGAYQISEASLNLLVSTDAQLRRHLIGSDPLYSSPLFASPEYLPIHVALQSASHQSPQPPNRIFGGDFEDLDQAIQSGWRHVRRPGEGIKTNVELSADKPQQGNYCLAISARPPSTDQPILAPAEPLVWITSPEVYCEADQAVEITGWVRIPEAIEGSIEALAISDSLGGSDLAIHVSKTEGWKPFRMIRGRPKDGVVRLSFSLSGYGTAAIDGVMVRPIALQTTPRIPPTPRAQAAVSEGPLLSSPALFGAPNMP